MTWSGEPDDGTRDARCEQAMSKAPAWPVEGRALACQGWADETNDAIAV